MAMFGLWTHPQKSGVLSKIERDEMEWVNSSGGPLICGEMAIATRWRGVFGLSSRSSVKSDYARACDAKEYLEVLRCGDGNVLVLGDEPLQSSFLRTESGGLTIARWMYASSEDRALEFLRASSKSETLASPIRFEINGDCLLMFDAAIGGENLTDHQMTMLERGFYSITTERVISKGVLDFIVHRFIGLTM